MYVDSETETDRKNELEVISIFCKKMNCNFQKLRKYDLDFLLYRNEKSVAFAEVKCRTHSFDKFDTQIISLKRHKELMNCSKWLPCFLIVKYTDGIFYIDAKDIPNENIKIGGRNNPRKERPNDVEPLIHFKRSLFKKI